MAHVPTSSAQALRTLRRTSSRPPKACAPTSDARRLLARDHTAPVSTLALAKAVSLGCERVRPLAWCSRPRSSAASLAGALMTTRWTWRLVAFPGVAWLSVFFLVSFYAVLCVALGNQDTLSQPIPFWNPLDWNVGYLGSVLSNIWHAG